MLPFGPGGRWLTDGGAMAAVFGGWQVNGLFLWQTGLPFTPTLSAATVNTGTGSRPDRIADGALSDPSVDRWFDPAAFTTPAQFTYGDAGRNILYGPGRVNVDLSIFKEFAVSQAVRLQFRAEVFQPVEHGAVRPAERDDWHGGRRHDHQHRRDASPDSVRPESVVLTAGVASAARQSRPLRIAVGVTPLRRRI